VRGTGILSGLATPGSLVDVLFRTNEAPTREIPEATVTLLSDVEVLAVQENITPGAKNPSNVTNVTLAVTSQQANALKITEGRGEYSLSLRPDNDPSLSGNAGPQTLEGLLGIKRRPPPPPRPLPKTVEAYRGSARSVLVFDGQDVTVTGPNVVPPLNDNPRPLNPATVPADGLPPQIENLIPKNLN